MNIKIIHLRVATYLFSMLSYIGNAKQPRHPKTHNSRCTNPMFTDLQQLKYLLSDETELRSKTFITFLRGM